jgi:hypothetical protein
MNLLHEPIDGDRQVSLVEKNKRRAGWHKAKAAK